MTKPDLFSKNMGALWLLASVKRKKKVKIVVRL